MHCILSISFLIWAENSSGSLQTGPARPGWRAPGVDHHHTGREVVLIAPPQHSTLRRPADIAGCTLLQHLSVPHAWTRWCEAHGVEGVNGMMGPQLDQFHSLIRAVMAGMGLALVPHCLVKDDIAAGLVSAPLDDGYTDEMGYYLCYPESRRQLQPLNELREWMLRTVQGDLQTAGAASIAIK